MFARLPAMKYLKAVLRALWYSTATLIIVFTVLMTLLRVASPSLARYKNNVAELVSQALKRPVTLSKFKVSWYWFEPLLQASEVRVLQPNHQHTIIKIKKLSLGFNAWQSILHRQIVPGRIIIEGAHIALQRDKDNHVHIIGLPPEDHTLQEIIAWLSLQQELLIKNFTVHWHEPDGQQIIAQPFAVTIINHGTKHYLNANARLQQLHATQLNLIASLTGSADDLDHWQGNIYLNLKHGDAAQWKHIVPMQHWQIQSGDINAKNWFTLKDSKIQAWQSQVQFNRVALLNNQTQNTYLAQTLKANLAGFMLPHGWLIKADKVQLQSLGEHWPETSLRISFRQNNGTKTLKLFFQHLNAQDVTGLFKYHLPSIKVKGYFNDTQLAWVSTPTMPQQWNLDTHLHNITVVDNMLKIGASNINGAINLMDTIDAKQLHHIDINKLVLANRTLSLDAKGHVDLAKVFKKTFANIKASVAINDLSKLKYLVPSKGLTPKFSQWLKNATPSGVAKSHIVINGILSAKPFDIIVGLQKLHLHYTNGFPDAKNVNAKVEFKGKQFTGTVSHALLGGNIINNAVVTIEDYLHPHPTITIQGNNSLQAKQALQFIKDSKLIHKLAFLNQLQLSGPLTLNLKLNLPLENHLKAATVLGLVTLNKNQLNLPKWNIALPTLSGTVTFTQNALTANHLSASLFNRLVNLSIHSALDAKGSRQSNVKFSGQQSIKTLKLNNFLPNWDWVKGDFSYSADILLPNAQDNKTLINIRSDLVGVQLLMPEPLRKTINEKKNIDVNLSIDTDNSRLLRVNYDNSLNLAAYLIHLQDAHILKRLAISLGGRLATLPTEQGITVSGSWPELQASSWLPFLNNSLGQQNTLPLLDANIGFKQLHALSQTWHNIQLDITKQNNSWDINTNGDEIKGIINFNNGRSLQLKARLTKLYLTEKSNKQQKLSFDFAKIPNLNISINQFTFNQKQLGTFKLLAKKTKNILIISKLMSEAPHQIINLKGQWLHNPHKDSSKFQGYLESNNLGAMLKSWKMPAIMQAKHAVFNYNISWPKRPWQFDSAIARGKIFVKLENGFISHLNEATLNKVNMGKLISILSLDRLLSGVIFNFGDLSHKGLGFDKVSGNFTLGNGNVRTQDTELNGPVAFIGMVGRIGLAKKDFDLKLRIAPHLTSSLPLLATVAGGPIAGIVSFVVEKVISKEVKKSKHYSYRITGPWAKPVVRKL